MEERAFPDIDNKVNLCYYSSQTLCTAYQTTVQTEQTVISYHGVGSQMRQWNLSSAGQ